jgi:hypothetical protein
MSRTSYWCWLVLGVFAAASVAQTTVTTSGATSAGTVPAFGPNSNVTVTNSPIFVSGNKMGVGTSAPATPIQIVADGTRTPDWSQLSIHPATCCWTGISLENILKNGNGSQTGTYWDLVSGNDGGSTGNFRIVALNSGGGIVSEPIDFSTSGNVGIGTGQTSIPSARLEVNGNVKLTTNSGASITFADGTSQYTAWTGVLCGGDYAEAVQGAGSRSQYGPGDVLELSSDEGNDVQKASEPYSTMVAGIYATKLGVIGKREALTKTNDSLPMAMVGIVPTKVSAENGPIRKGDMLVSSSTPGHAMKGTDRTRMLGAVIGKAMGSLEMGTGVIEVLVTLQ